MAGDHQAGAEVVAASGIGVTQTGAVAEILLDRPGALNALTTDMRAVLAASYPEFARDPQVYAVTLRSSSPRAFCAGGDIREVTRWGREKPQEARRSLYEEYSLNWLHECFSKPTVSLIDGLVVGSGVGISLYGTHRVAGAGYSFARPETAIGLFPDDGLAWTFARMPDAIGVYLGLTGRRIGRADAYELGLVTHCIEAARFEAIRAALASAETVDPLLDGLHEDPGAGELAGHRGLIGDCFSAPSVEEIIARLGAVSGAGRGWAHAARAELLTRSPLSLAVTLRHIREATARDLQQTLTLDYRLACRFLEGEDFYEGVRALLIDKDGAPRWRPDSLAGVTPGMVERCFGPILPQDGGELVLATRQEMQAARV